jgi:hypothetical protein
VLRAFDGLIFATTFQHSTLNTQHSTLNTQHSTLNIQHSTFNIQHPVMSNMEPEVRDFLRRIAWSVGLVLLYLIMTMTIGIYGAWFFFYDHPRTGNYIFYAWTLLSGAGVVFAMARLWKKKFPHG